MAGMGTITGQMVTVQDSLVRGAVQGGERYGSKRQVRYTGTVMVQGDVMQPNAA